MKLLRLTGRRLLDVSGKRLCLVALIFFPVLFCAYSSVSADDISAAAAIVIDAKADRILYAKNPNLKVPPASTTKLVTAMVVLDKLDPDKEIIVGEGAAHTPSVPPRLRPGERLTVRALLNLALMRSINGAAVALAEAAAGSEKDFTNLMNAKAASIGAESTHFVNASGLPAPGQYITAHDLAKVMKASIQYPLIKEIVNTRVKNVYTMGGRQMFLKNTNLLLWDEDDMIGGKTGYTRAARHCFVCASDKGDTTMISVVLGEAVRDNLWEDSKTLLAKGSDVLENKAEPMISLTTDETGPVVFASYKKSSGKKRLKANGHKAVKKAKLKERKIEAKAVKASRHSHRSGKSARKASKGLSAGNQSSTDRVVSRRAS
jgi:D-alanyl-D-alanine carboxypeptidase (penicillin-binding protein 5/6)